MSQQGITAVYPGSFDPFHLGHLEHVLGSTGFEFYPAAAISTEGGTRR